MVGSLGWESMANAICTVGSSLGFSNVLFLLLPSTLIHLSSSFSPSSNVPARRQSVSESAYPPSSVVKVWRGLNSTSSSSAIDLKR